MNCIDDMVRARVRREEGRVRGENMQFSTRKLIIGENDTLFSIFFTKHVSQE